MALTKEWLQLKNGSDIRGVASEGVEGSPINLTDKKTYRIAVAFAQWLKNRLNKENIKIALGHDSRISAERLKKACISGFIDSGVFVLDCGMCTTPAMFMTCVDKEISADGSVMITASHLPFNRNGLKFFTQEGGLESSDITEILELAQNGEIKETQNGSLQSVDFLKIYSESIINKIVTETNNKNPLKGFKIAVDAGNGVGGFYAEILKKLGADISGSVFLEPDGMFPNHVPNPEDKKAMEAISKAVIQSKSDLGIIFDTDVDRAAIVDSEGREINKNRLIALISAILLKDKKGTIVTDSVTSAGLKEFIEKDLKGCHHRFKRGYKNVINEAIRLNKEGIYCPLAIETSGHAALKENHFLDDGAYLVTKILIEMINLKSQGKNIFELISSLKEANISYTFRIPIETEDFKTYGQKVIDDLYSYIKDIEGFEIEKENYEGIRVNLGADGKRGWFLLRLSLHDPILPLDIESDSREDANYIIKSLVNFFEKYDKLNIETLLRKE